MSKATYRAMQVSRPGVLELAGGYAEMLPVRSTGLVAIPDELDSQEAAPLPCAGIAAFNALKQSGAQAGDVVAVQGIGGLGHLGLQYARKMASRSSPSGAARRSAAMRRHSARTSASMLARKTPPHVCASWAERKSS